MRAMMTLLLVMHGPIYGMQRTENAKEIRVRDDQAALDPLGLVVYYIWHKKTELAPLDRALVHAVLVLEQAKLEDLFERKGVYARLPTLFDEYLEEHKAQTRRQ